ncbi:glycosyltransferase family 2 protein [Neobacillus drentensis]|uniref:glycosyltransferase family 2 protein n=1 Tax=Neobacillus drentensis TaxID=220684 RepID=UPI002FFFBAAE
MSEIVSIIVPVYNMGNSIKNTINSILVQDYKNIEVILVDDGSKDDSYKVCKEIASQDDRVKCIHTENQGSGPARNVGIKASKGKYLYFPDADDFLEPHAISVLVSAMNDGTYDLVVFGYQCLSHQGTLVFERTYSPFSNTGESVRADYKNYFDMLNSFSIQGAPWNKFFDGDTIRKNNIEYPPLRRHQDEGFISRYMCYCKNIRFIPDVLYKYYQNTVELEWVKYPVNYIDAVIGLRDIWNETICRWNPEDQITHKLVNEVIFSKIMRALELSYSPKMKLNLFTRANWIKKTCKKANFLDYKFNIAGSLYQKIVLAFLKIHFYFCASIVLSAGDLKKRRRKNK